MVLPKFKQLIETSSTISCNNSYSTGVRSDLLGLVKNTLNQRKSKQKKVTEGALLVEMK